jgi:membrane protein
MSHTGWQAPNHLRAPTRTGPTHDLSIPTSAEAANHADVFAQMFLRRMARSGSGSGVALYGMLAIFPALAAMVAIYGLMLDPVQFGAQIPVPERRNLFHRAALSLLLTLGAIAGGIVAIAGVVVLPPLLEFRHLAPLLHRAAAYARWPIVAAVVWFGLLVLYRFGPDRRSTPWSWRDRGAALAIVLWLAGSAAFALYVRNAELALRAKAAAEPGQAAAAPAAPGP